MHVANSLYNVVEKMSYIQQMAMKREATLSAIAMDVPCLSKDSIITISEFFGQVLNMVLQYIVRCRTAGAMIRYTARTMGTFGLLRVRLYWSTVGRTLQLHRIMQRTLHLRRVALENICSGIPCGSNYGTSFVFPVLPPWHIDCMEVQCETSQPREPA
jgi:hypothetical protein